MTNNLDQLRAISAVSFAAGVAFTLCAVMFCTYIANRLKVKQAETIFEIPPHVETAPFPCRPCGASDPGYVTPVLCLPGDDCGMRRRLRQSVLEQANDLIATAAALDTVVEISLKPCWPLAMGSYAMVADVRAARWPMKPPGASTGKAVIAS